MWGHELHSIYFAAAVCFVYLELHDVCLTTVAVNVLMLSWFDPLLLCISHTCVRRDFRPRSKSLEHGCRCIAAVVLLYTDINAVRLSDCFATINNSTALQKIKTSGLMKWYSGRKSGAKTRIRVRREQDI